LLLASWLQHAIAVPTRPPFLINNHRHPFFSRTKSFFPAAPTHRAPQLTDDGRLLLFFSETPCSAVPTEAKKPFFLRRYGLGVTTPHKTLRNAQQFSSSVLSVSSLSRARNCDPLSLRDPLFRFPTGFQHAYNGAPHRRFRCFSSPLLLGNGACAFAPTFGLVVISRAGRSRPAFFHRMVVF